MQALSQQAAATTNANAKQTTAAAEQALHNWLSQLQQLLTEQMPEPTGLHTSSELARQWQTIADSARHCLAQWQAAWEQAQPAQHVASVFDAQLMLLVFGKFNAGKSSLCNFLAQRWAKQGWQIRYFYIEQGRIIESDQPLTEGATETTARLQGVVIGERLVLLDTPGLHSVTPENAELTQRFTDSADAVLWLTSSTSPGQVQELDELARELQRHKPLLPVITRSDFVDEDEVDGAICKVLCNKSPSNRTLQERDVRERTQAKLEQLGARQDLLRTPVSISVHMAKAAADDEQQVLQAAGFEAWFAALHTLAAPALAYKQRKSAEVQLHHLQEQVLRGLQQQVLAPLQQWLQALEAECERLAHAHEPMARAVWRQLMPQLALWMAEVPTTESPESRQQQQAIAAQLEQALHTQLQAQWELQRQDWRLSPGATPELTAAQLAHIAAQATSASGWAESVYRVVGEMLQQQMHDPHWLPDWLAPLRQHAQALQTASVQWQDRLQSHCQALSRLAAQMRAQG